MQLGDDVGVELGLHSWHQILEITHKKVAREKKQERTEPSIGVKHDIAAGRCGAGTPEALGLEMM